MIINDSLLHVIQYSIILWVASFGKTEEYFKIKKRAITIILEVNKIEYYKLMSLFKLNNNCILYKVIGSQKNLDFVIIILKTKTMFI